MSGFGDRGHSARGKRPAIEYENDALHGYTGSRLEGRRVTGSARRRGLSVPSTHISNVGFGHTPTMSRASIDHMPDVKRHLLESSSGVLSRRYSYHKHIEEDDKDEPSGPGHEDEDDDTKEEAYVLGRESIRRHGCRGGKGYRGARPGPSHGQRPDGDNALLDTGGLEILDVLVGFRGHVARAIWNGEVK